MECVFGLVGNGFAIVVADSSAVHSILVHKSNEDKIMVLDSHKLIAASGEAGDRFSPYPPFFCFLSLLDFWVLIGFLSCWVFRLSAEFNSLSIYRKTWLCINSVMGFLWPQPLQQTSLEVSSPLLCVRYKVETNLGFFFFFFFGFVIDVKFWVFHLGKLQWG